MAFKKKKKCEKPHVADLPLYPFENVHMRYMKASGDTYINGYAVIKMLQRIGLHQHATALAVRLAEMVQKD